MRTRSIFLIFGAAIAAGAVWRVATRDKDAENSGVAPSRDVQVAAAMAVRRDVPIYLTGLGRVQALNTVVVRSQVDGRIVAMPFQEGAEVKPGELLIQIDPRPYQALLDQAAGKLEQDQAQLQNARAILKRDSELLEKGMLDHQGFETQASAVAQTEALAKTDAGALAAARINVEFTHIVSPIAGRVGLRQVDPGNLVHASDTTSLATIVQIEPIALVFVLPERDLGRVNEALGAGPGRKNPAVFAVDRDNSNVLDTGELMAVDNQIDVATGTFKLKAVFKNVRQNLSPGQFLNARLLVATRKRGVVVPAGAVQQGPDGEVVFVIGPDSKVEMRTVKVEQSDGGAALVSSGLDGGERVVVDGQLLLRPHDRVRINGPVSTAP